MDENQWHMKEDILMNLDNPRQLEKLFQSNKHDFKKAFNSIYPEINSKTSAQVWNERLNYESEVISWGSKKELVFVIAAAVMAGLLAKIPVLFGLPGTKEEIFYQRNIGFIVLPILCLYFAWKKEVNIKNQLIILAVILISVVYINLLPNQDNFQRDSTILACLHMPLLLWSVLGFTFTGNEYKNLQKRLDFLRFNGDLAVMTALILIAGGILTALTLGLFAVIDVDIEEFYFNYIVVWGLAAAPVVGTYLVQSNPYLVGKVSPVIAKIFTPLVLIMLTIYLITVFFSGKNPYEDRDFLIVFNILLIGVMALILFSVAETTKNENSKLGILLLLGLSIITIVVNGIALSAILYRISEWGFTPNRVAVLGGNLIILCNLLIVAFRLFNSTKNPSETSKVETSIASYLPIYTIWTILVIFGFPLIFGFR